MAIIDDAQLLEDLLDVSIALSAERDFDNLLDLILREIRRTTNADAGTIYLVTNTNQLQFRLSQVQTLFDRWGEQAVRDRFKRFEMDISKESMAGYVALTGEILNIPDVKKIPESAAYKYNSAYDEENEYESHSMLVVPIKNSDGVINGVLQIINAFDDSGKIIPFNERVVKIANSLASMAGVALHNVQLNQNLHDAQLETVLKLGVAAEYRDKETANHIRRMSRYAYIIGGEMGWSQPVLMNLIYAASMHDVGKLGVPDDILLKPGRLTAEERPVMMQHTVIGGLILNASASPLLQMSKQIALTHHERWDGHGYPNRLAGGDIPIEGCIVSVADVYDALSSRRCYKEPWSEPEVVDYMTKNKGSQFDTRCVEILLDNLTAVRSIQEKYADAEEDFEKMGALSRVDTVKLLRDNDYLRESSLNFQDFFVR